MEFCPGCGKKSAGICRDCRPVKEIRAKEIVLKVCSRCGKHFNTKIWVAGDLKNALEKLARNAIREDISSISFEIPQLKHGKKEEIPLKIMSEEDEFVIPSAIEVTYCDTCRKHGGYYEGVLQLRDLSEEMIDFVKEYCHQNSIHISDEVSQEHGMDLKLSDKKKLQNLGQELQKKFGGTLKVNAQLFTRNRQTSKDVYRLHVYYEALDFKVGDAVFAENKLLMIKSIGKTIAGLDLFTDKKVNIILKGKDYEVLKPFKTKVSRIYPKVEILNEDYQSIPIKNTRDVKLDENVKAVNYKGSYYLF
ncbi:MAG: NMD3-related protein [Candidatus Woesearchaeota archaeon]|nr:NMD3-related protein [Candidatus Woesearchaeota archaeon]